MFFFSTNGTEHLRLIIFDHLSYHKANIMFYLLLLFFKILMYVPGKLSLAVINYSDQKQFAEFLLPFDLFHLTILWSQSVTEESQEGAEAETMEQCYLLACLHGLLSLFPYITQDHLPKISTTHSGRGLSHQSLVKKMSLCLAYRPI